MKNSSKITENNLGRKPSLNIWPHYHLLKNMKENFSEVTLKLDIGKEKISSFDSWMFAVVLKSECLQKNISYLTIMTNFFFPNNRIIFTQESTFYSSFISESFLVTKHFLHLFIAFFSLVVSNRSFILVNFLMTLETSFSILSSINNIFKLQFCQCTFKRFTNFKSQLFRTVLTCFYKFSHLKKTLLNFSNLNILW